MPIVRDGTRWLLETERTAYVFGLNADGLLAHCYWGVRLPRLTDYPGPVASAPYASFNNAAHLTREEYPGVEDMKFVDPAVQTRFADGVRGAVLRFSHDQITDDTLQIVLCDTAYPLELTLHYRVHSRYDLIERWTTLRNTGDAPIMIERAMSAQWHLPPNQRCRMSMLAGRWLDEFHVERTWLPHGRTVIDSRRITTSHHHSPWFAIDHGTADEDQGAVWFGVLAWSGNWQLSAEFDTFGATRLNIGLNDWDFALRIDPAEAFSTPAAFAGYTTGGFGAASRSLHRFVRERVLPHANAPHQILYNSWEATLFDVDVTSQQQLADLAANIGVELFVMDDGWFHNRNDDTAGLGDWWPDARKFPDGLAPLIQHVNDLGMQFGLWIEPEMVNPNSDLYRAHPEWVIHYPTRERTTGRHQLILNLARPDVQGYLIDQVDRLLRDNNIAFIKWDMNRNVSEPGWPDTNREQRELWVRYVEGLYHVWQTLRERFPDVIWQSCSGGGGRADFGMLRLADQIWTSDNTEPTARLRIQEGFSQTFPAATMEAWVTDMGADWLPLQFRFHVSMCGVLGIGGHLLHWGAERRAEAARYVSEYKAIRHIVQQGDLYRLRSPHAHPFSALQYVTADARESVLFAFRTHLPPPALLPPVYPRGLEPEALYREQRSGEARSGLAWMQVGIQLELHDYDSVLLHFRRVAEPTTSGS